MILAITLLETPKRQEATDFMLLAVEVGDTQRPLVVFPTTSVENKTLDEMSTVVYR